MATIRRFDDLELWQHARELCNVVFRLNQHETFSKDYKLMNQINASNGSVMDTIAEGFDRGGRKEFVNFLGIAKGSCGETKSQLYRARDRNYISEQEFQSAYSLADQINRKTHALIAYLNSTDIKGQKYKGRVDEPISLFGEMDIEFTENLSKHEAVNKKP